MYEKIVFDIETVGFNWDVFSSEEQEYLLNRADIPQEEREQVKKKETETIKHLSFYALTAQIVAISMFNPDTNKGKVFYIDPGMMDSTSSPTKEFSNDDELIKFVPVPKEEEILKQFWNLIGKYKQFITFNGSGFDCPFILLRSVLLGIKPTRNLMPYKFSYEPHCDLMSQLTFYGAIKPFSLDFYCRRFGITSPKEDGISGKDVAILFKQGQYEKIARYCLEDTRATAKLYFKWLEFLKF